MRNSTTSSPDVTGNIAHALWRAADARAGGEAIVDARGATTYDALRGHASAIAQSLWNRGILPGDRVALLLERSETAAAVMFGVWASGAVGVCINERLRPRQIEHMLRHSGARLLVSTAEMMARQPRMLETEAEIIDVDTLPILTPFRLTPVARSDADFAQIVYTSGSTGLPKGVAFTHGNLRAAMDIVAGYLGIRAYDRVASLLGFSSVYGMNQMLCAVRSGACLVIETSPLATKIIETLRDQSVTVAAAVPPLWLQLLSVPEFRKPIRSLRQLQNAGGHLPKEVTRQLRAFHSQAQLFLQYGMTETFRSTFLAPDEVDRRPDCMGRAMPRTDIFVVREDLTPCEPGEVGELVHRGPTVAAGYWNDSAATDLVFRPDPFATNSDAAERVVFSGDLVRRDADGFLYYVSRRDRLIKTLGYRVGPDEIADVLFASGEVNECVVTTEPDPRRVEQIVAFAVLNPGGSLERLTQYARMELPRHMTPARIAAVDSLPRLPSGKYDVAALRDGRAQIATEY